MEQRHDLVVRLQKQLLPPPAPARAHACADRRELKGRRSCVRCVGHFPAPVATAPRGGVKAHPTPMENASLLLAVLVAGVARALRRWRGPAGVPVRLTGSFGLVTALRCGVARIQLGTRCTEARKHVQGHGVSHPPSRPPAHTPSTPGPATWSLRGRCVT